MRASVPAPPDEYLDIAEELLATTMLHGTFTSYTRFCLMLLARYERDGWPDPTEFDTGRRAWAYLVDRGYLEIDPETKKGRLRCPRNRR